MNVGIVGLGLIGGSMAKMVKAKTDCQVFGFDRFESEIYAAKLYQAIDQTLDENTLPTCDIVLIATYPQGVAAYIAEHLEEFKQDALVIDLSGVKRDICSTVKEIVKGHQFTFMGGHPMAGKQFSGFKYASADLFQAATMILTPDMDASIAVREQARDFFLKMGFKQVHFTTPEEHDRKVAYTSQLAHIVSNAYIKSPSSADCDDISAGSYRDMTRVAKLNAAMWTELFMQNGDYLGAELDTLIRHLTEYAEAIADRDEARLTKLLEEGNAR